jgi:DNA replication protein DnaC
MRDFNPHEIFKAAGVPNRFKDSWLSNFDSVQGSVQHKQLIAASKLADDIIAGADIPGGVFMGEPGLGKTHLACGIIRTVCGSGQECLYTTIQKFARHVKSAWNTGESEESVLAQYRRPRLLVIDEIGVQFKSDTEGLYLTEMVNDRYNDLKATILISNLGMDELRDVVGARVLDRFNQGGVPLVFSGSSFRKQLTREKLELKETA